MTNWRVDFKSKNQDQKNFHKAYTFVMADTAEKAAQRVMDVRPDEEVIIIGSPKEVAR
jgi:hypothetical protein